MHPRTFLYLNIPSCQSFPNTHAHLHAHARAHAHAHAHAFDLHIIENVKYQIDVNLKKDRACFQIFFSLST